MSTLVIRKAKINDLTELQKIGKQTFRETFSAGNTEKDLAQYLSESFSTQQLTAELNDQKSEIYFALVNDDSIGYLKVNWEESQTELQDKKAFEIERIYVLKDFHGKKVGQLLLQKAIQIAKEKGVNYIWLGVWEENTRAIQFYKKYGFVEFDKHIFKLGDDEQTDIMMKLTL